MELRIREPSWRNTRAQLPFLGGWRLVLWVVFCAGGLAWAQGQHTSETSLASENLMSRSVARLFYQHAFDIVYSGEGEGRPMDEAVAFLMAARALDTSLTDASLTLFDIASQTQQAYLEPIVQQWLPACPAGAFGKPGVHKAMRYLIGRQSQRGGMENTVLQLQSIIGKNNPFLDSELLTHLGLAALQRPEQRGAGHYFSRAYQRNKYNKLAFAQLTELAPDQVNASMTLEHLRLSIRENPLDPESALAFAQYAERLQLFDIAAGSYAYCADLFEYLYGDSPLPGHVYIPWAISCYNSKTALDTVPEIAERVRQGGGFDIFLEAIAGRALEKAGDQQAADALFEVAETKATALLESVSGAPDPKAAVVHPRAMAWYYCFGRENAEQALDWANKAYTLDPNDAATTAVLAYTLVLNNRNRLAQHLVEQGPVNQISEMARAHIQWSEGQLEAGLTTMRAAIDRDPGSLAADSARQLLAAKGRPYAQLVGAQEVLGALVNSLGERIVPQFKAPNAVLKARLTTMNTAIPFGGQLGGILTIINQSDEPLIIGPHGLFRGRVRVDADIAGAVTRSFKRINEMDLFGTQVVGPRRSVTGPLTLIVGPLRTFLQSHPQASINITFTVYLDPAQREDGTIWNRLVDVEPIRIQIGRPGIQITEKSLRTQYNAIAVTDVPSKIRTAQLFAGLLLEQQTMAREGVLYPFRYADWMPAWLTSALADPAGLLLDGHEQAWEVKTHALSAIQGLTLEASLLQALGQCLHDSYWPVRFQAVKLIAENPTAGSNKVLAWTAKHDVHPLVRSLATLLASQAEPE